MSEPTTAVHQVMLVVATSAGGVGQHVRAIARGLAARGVPVTVVGPTATDAVFRFAGDGVRFTAVEMGARPDPLRDARAVRRLRRLSAGAAVVHAHGLRAGGLAAMALLPPGPRPPLAVTLHNAVLGGGPVGAVYGVLERLVAARAAVALAVSGDLEARLRRRGARDVRHALVPAPPLARPSADPTAWRNRLGAQDRPVLVTVGRLSAQKGYPLLLAAAARWRDDRPPPLVAVAGDGPLRERLDARIAAEALPVRLLGRVDDVAGLLAAADLAVMPSVWEGQPLWVQEALAAGVPVVATAVGGVPEMVGDAGVLVPEGDVDALVVAVRRLLTDPAARAGLAARARARAAELPSGDDALAQVLGLYRELGARC